MANSYMLMWLEAPLQSWGYDSRFLRKDTLDFPTRSGVLGLILCAMGAGGPQKEWLSTMSHFGQRVLAFERKQNSPKTENNLKLMDFHMVGSGYDDSDPWQSLLVPKTVSGEKPKGSTNGVKLTYRYYLQDKVFAVILETPEDFVPSIEAAMKAPHWDLYLGRKCCAPTDLIFRGIYSSESQAKAEALKIAAEKELQQTFEVIEGNHPDLGDVLTLTDVPVQFGSFKKYVDREVTVIDARTN